VSISQNRCPILTEVVVTKHKQIRVRDAFTLIELLVVISIIALLVSILMPALAKARKQAKNMVCAADMRQWGIAVQLYGMDNEGYFPYNGDPSWDFDWVHPTTIQFFADYLFPLMEGAKERGNDILFCPTDKYSRFMQTWFGQAGVDDGLVGYKVIFGNDMDHLLKRSTKLGQCNALDWATRKKLGGRYSKGPILMDNLQSLVAGGPGSPESWVDDVVDVRVASHAGRKNFIPEGGNFLFEGGSVTWYSGIESADGQSNGEIYAGVQQGGWLIYCSLPNVF